MEIWKLFGMINLIVLYFISYDQWYFHKSNRYKLQLQAWFSAIEYRSNIKQILFLILLFYFRKVWRKHCKNLSKQRQKGQP